MALLWLVGAATALGQVDLQVTLSGPSGAINTGEPFRVSIDYRCASVSTAAVGARITVAIPAEVGYVSHETSPHVQNVSIDWTTRRITYVMVDPLPAGVAGQVAFTGVLINGPTPDGSTHRVTADFTAANAPTGSAAIDLQARAQPRLEALKYTRAATSLGGETYYNINVCNGSDGVNTPASLDLHNVVVRDTLPAGATFLRFYNSTPSATGTYNATSRVAQITVPKLGPGQCAWLGIAVRYNAPSSSVGQFRTNRTHVTADPLGKPRVTVTSSTTHQLLPTEAKTTVVKTVSSGWIMEGNSGSYELDFSNEGTVTLAGARLLDTLPYAAEVLKVTTGQWSKPGTVVVDYVTLWYQTNLQGWRQWGPANRNAAVDGQLDIADIGLTPGGAEYITALRWDFGDAPAGFYAYGPPKVYFRVRMGTPEGPVRNCATGASSSAATHTRGCATFNVMAAPVRAYMGPSLWFAPATGLPYTVGDQVTINFRLTNYAPALRGLTDLAGAMVLPEGLEPVLGSEALDVNTSALGLPTVTIDPDFRGSGRKRWLLTWPPGTNTLAPGEDIHVRYTFLVTSQLPAGQPASRLEFVQMTSEPASDCWSASIADVYDLDGDGSTTDLVCSNGLDLNVADFVAMSSELAVRGTLDAGYHTHPATGRTLPGGRADYRLTLRNDGNVALDRIVSLDLLPALGDVGVIDPSPRNSAWGPKLAGPVVAPPGVTVYYSTAARPCRAAEGFLASDPAGCQPPGWSIVPPAAITTVTAIKIDFGTRRLEPGEILQFEYPMRVPIDVLSQPGVSPGALAYNSAAFLAYRAGTSTRLLPAEPVKTGLAIQALSPGVIGDRIWRDTDGDGIQDAGEPGLDNVYVALYRDDGDGLVDPARDTYVGFTISAGNGGYLFPNLPTGDYFVLVERPPTFGLSPKQAGADASRDSDGALGSLRGYAVAVSGVFRVTDTDFDYSRDFGFVPDGTAAIGDYVWRDTDGDGIQDEGAAAGLDGVTVQLLNGAGAVYGSTQTSADIAGVPGYYLFDALPPGSYRVRLIRPTGATLSPASQGPDRTSDSDAAPSSGLTPLIVLAAGQYTATVDFGLQPSATEICDNGIDDDGDTAIDCADGECPSAGSVVRVVRW